MKGRFLAVLCACMLLCSSCEESVQNFDEEEPPVLPSLEAVQMNFDGLSLSQKSNFQTQVAHGAARETAVVLDNLQQSQLSIVRGTITFAGGQEAELIGEGEWQWKADDTDDDPQEFRTRVVAKMGEEDIRWDVFLITSAPGLPGVELELKILSGTSSFDGNNGDWRVINQFTESTDATIQWEVTDSVSTINARFFVVGQQNPHTEINYTSRGNNKHIDYTNTITGETTLNWDSEQRSGYIRQSNLNNGIRLCWDGDYNDIICQ